MEEEKQNTHQSEHSKHQPSEGTETFTPKISEAGEIKTLLFWEAPARPFRKKDRSYYTFSSALVILVCLSVFFWLKDILLIAAILALMFVAYVLAFVPPNRIKYRISTQGITIGEDFYFWHFLDSFWFKKKEGYRVVHIQTRFRFPGQLMLVLEGVDENDVKKIVARFLPFHEIPYKGWMEKWTEGLQKHFPLENIHR